MSMAYYTSLITYLRYIDIEIDIATAIAIAMFML